MAKINETLNKPPQLPDMEKSGGYFDVDEFNLFSAFAYMSEEANPEHIGPAHVLYKHDQTNAGSLNIISKEAILQRMHYLIKNGRRKK